jgi:hypothetical protein
VLDASQINEQGRLAECLRRRQDEGSMIAKLAYLTTPSPGRYMLHFQAFGSDEQISIEVGPDQMRNILSDGVALMLRQSFHRVPTTPAGREHERTDDRR